MAFNRYKVTKPTKRSRTLPIHGEAEDADKYFRCWNCGFICDVDRDSLGDSESLGGPVYENYSADPVIDSEFGKELHISGELEHFHYIIGLEADGSEVAPQVYLRPVAKRGCPLCGTLNWRGDYP